MSAGRPRRAPGDDAGRSPSAVGWLLREWRATRGLSQLALANEAGISARHLSFVETGRAEPSRELLLRLGATLGMPPRDRNALLAAAGFQPVFRGTAWEDRDAAELLHAVQLILRGHEPFGALALSGFEIVMVNAAFAHFASFFLGPDRLPRPFELAPRPRLDMLALTFDPDAGFRRHVRNWQAVARQVLWQARAELAAHRSRRGREQLDAVMRYPGVAELADCPAEPGPGFVLPVEIEIGGQLLRLFTTLTTLGTPQDLIASELRIEAYHPADAATEALLRAADPQTIAR
jgi:transcriptional regulator with XRE-family HTH domain